MFAGSVEPILPIPADLPDLDAKKVALGFSLFSDKRMSHDDTIACSSCHQLNQAGVDHRRFFSGIKGQIGDINTPTIFNSRFNFRQFWNGRAPTLEDQIDSPVSSPGKMGSSWEEVIGKLRLDETYPTLFLKIYEDGITAKNIKDALATFERSLVTPNSRFDQFLRGNSHAITADELNGYKLFKSYGCISCHQGMNVGGNMFEKLGIMNDYFNTKGQLSEADMGRYSYTKVTENLHEFKVPSLRNVARTAPYFHDGSAATLSAAVIIMGKYQLGLDLPADDVTKIAAFLNTLTGEYNGSPL
ncbi:MAG: cytochrome c peroxidase [Pseudomonadota bacterium]